MHIMWKQAGTQWGGEGGPHIKKTETQRCEMWETGWKRRIADFSVWEISPRKIDLNVKAEVLSGVKMGLGPNLCLLCLFHSLQCLPADQQQVVHILCLVSGVCGAWCIYFVWPENARFHSCSHAVGVALILLWRNADKIQPEWSHSDPVTARGEWII